jgi:signal transduction histidine kinase
MSTRMAKDFREQVVRHFLRVNFLATLLVLGLATAPAIALDRTRSIVEMFHKAYSIRDGAPAAVMSITQTADGFLWLGSRTGLYRFDGVQFERYEPEKLPTQSVLSVASTKNGDLWIGFEGGGVSRLRDGEIAHYPPSQGGPLGRTDRVVEEAGDGAIWALSDFLPWRFDGETWKAVPGDWHDDFVDGAIWSLQTAGNGIVWAKNGEAVFYWIAGQDRFKKAPGFAGGVMGFARDKAGRVWTSDTDAPGHMYAMPDISDLNTVDQGRQRGARIPADIGGRVFLDRDGTLWNYTQQSGIRRARSVESLEAQDVVDTFTKSDGLTSDQVNVFYEDREGNIWIGTSLGVDMLRHAIVVAERRIPKTSTWYQTVIAASGDSLFALSHFSDDASSPNAALRGTLYRIEENGQVDVVATDIAGQSLAPAPDGSLWIAEVGRLRRLGAEGLVTVPGPPGLRHGLGDVAVDPDGAPWMSITGNGVWQRANGVWTRIAAGDALSGMIPVSIYFDLEGTTWLYSQTDQSLVRLSTTGTEEFTPPAGPNIGLIRTMLADERGALFLGERGLARYSAGTFHTLTTERLPALEFSSGIVHAHGDTWINTRAGILRFQTLELERAILDPAASVPRYDHFQLEDGLGEFQTGSAAVNTAMLAPNGRVWFATDHEVVWVDPSNISRNLLPPPVVIHSLTVNDQTFASPRDLVLPPGSSTLQIAYTALSFTEPSRVQFRYRLEGVDRDWVDPGQRRQAFYTQLGAGTYDFHVIASNDAGVWNEEGARITLTIDPTFLQSIWFKVLLGLAAAGVAGWVYALSAHQASARVQRRFEIRLAERERIARELHDTLLQSFQGLMLRFQAIAYGLAPGSELRGSIDDALGLAETVLVEGRERVRDLRAARTHDMPQSIMDSVSGIMSGDDPRFSMIVKGLQRALLAPVSEEVLRILEEIVRNAVQHSKGSVVEAQIVYGKRDFQLIVRDDGIGIDESILKHGGRAGHYGLSGMQERAKSIGGRLVVTCPKGGGTEVELSVPARKAYRERWPSLLDKFRLRPTRLNT